MNALWVNTRTRIPTGLLSMIALSCVLLACGQGSAATNSSAHPSVTPSRTPNPPATPPPGGPAPAQLIGDWVQTPFASNPNDDLDLIVNASTFSFQTSGDSNFGDVVVNGAEIDFFNGDGCGLMLPDGVGRYQWSLQGGKLHFTPLSQDPCGMRSLHLSDQIYAKR